MKKLKKIVITVLFTILSISYFSSCGAQTIALFFCLVQTVDDNAEYFKIDSDGKTTQRKFDENRIDIENDFFKIESSISCIGEKFKFEFPNIMHQIKTDPYSLSLCFENTSNFIDYILVKNVAVNFNGMQKDLLNEMIFSDNSEERNYYISVSKVYSEHKKFYGRAEKQQYKEFFDKNRIEFLQKNVNPQEENFTIRECYISFPEINFNDAQNLSLHYEIEIYNIDGNVIPVHKDIKFILKKETVKLYNPIFNNGKK